mgnify:FL=1
MKEISLTQGLSAIVDDIDYDSLIQWPKHPMATAMIMVEAIK